MSTAAAAQSAPPAAALGAQASPVSPAPLAGTPAAIVAAYARAHERAAAAKLVAYRTDDPCVFQVPSETQADRRYTVRVTGRRFYDLTCDCAGGNHIACKHRAVVVHGRKYHVWARRPQVTVALGVRRCAGCGRDFLGSAGVERCADCLPANVTPFVPREAARLHTPTALDELFG